MLGVILIKSKLIPCPLNSVVYKVSRIKESSNDYYSEWAFPSPYLLMGLCLLFIFNFMVLCSLKRLLAEEKGRPSPFCT